MDFDEAESRFYELKGRLDTGKLTPQEYQARLRELTVLAPDGHTWMIGGQTGRWYFFEAGSWVQGEPKRPPPAGATVGPQAQRCARCGQPVLTGRSICERCDQSVGASGSAPPPPPPLATRSVAAVPREPGGNRAGRVTAIVLALAAVLLCAGVAAAAVLLPDSPLRSLLPAIVAAPSPAPPAPALAATDTPTLAPTPEATSAPVATATIAPTRTPAPPTATSTGTATHTPPPTLTPVPATATRTSTPLPPTATATRAPTAVPKPALSGRIAYTVFDAASGANNIYVINADGTGASQVISQGMAPSWSPDGRIAYHSLRSDQLGLVVRYPDGATQYLPRYQVLHEDGMPSWSPDVSRIALAWGDNSGQRPWRIVIIKADGGDRYELAGFSGMYPSWGPGGLIAFRRVYSQEGLYLIGPEGGTPRLLANVGNDTAAAWSPDGSRVAFMADKESSGDWEIYVINADGSGLKNLTNTPGVMDVLPAWLPGGRHIAFRSNRGGAWGLWIMNDDGTGAVRIAQAALDTNRFLEDRVSVR